MPKSVDIELRCTQASFFNLPPESAWTAGLVSKGGAAVPCLKQGIAHACACCFKSGARPRSPFCHLSICTVPAQHEELTAASAAVKHMQAQPRLLSPTSSSSTSPPPPSPHPCPRVLVQHCPVRSDKRPRSVLLSSHPVPQLAITDVKMCVSLCPLPCSQVQHLSSINSDQLRYYCYTLNSHLCSQVCVCVGGGKWEYSDWGTQIQPSARSSAQLCRSPAIISLPEADPPGLPVLAFRSMSACARRGRTYAEPRLLANPRPCPS